MSSDLTRELFVQLAVIIVAARAGAWLFSRLGQPEVVGEILAGLALGPSILGRFDVPLFAEHAFAETGWILHAISELGLVLFMFMVGLEFDFAQLRNSGRAAAGIAIAGMIVPFTLGTALAYWLHPRIASETPLLGFILFFATTLSITAIPILGRIMIELGIQRTRLGMLTITAAAVDDVLGWLLLAGVSALVTGGFEWQAMLSMFVMLVSFVVLVVAVTSSLSHVLSRAYTIDRPNSVASLAAVIAFVLLSAVVTQTLGVFSVFGPFILGAALSPQRLVASSVISQLRPLVYALLLPVFFTRTGLQTDVGQLDSTWLWGVCALVVLVASFGKMVGCGVPARLCGLSWSETAAVAVMMNTRALMGIVAINVGRELGVVPPSVFTILVFMAITTTLTTTPVLRRLPD
ncbi:MAG: cation:proton antiporter [Pirellulales bacterium]